MAKYKKKEKAASKAKREYAIIYSMVGVTSDDEKIKEFLQSGYEPFSVSTQLVPNPEAQNPKLVLADKSQQPPPFITQTILWFKYASKVEVMTQEEVDLEKLNKFEADQNEKDLKEASKNAE